MKKHFLSFLLILIVKASFGQSSWNITFDDTSYLYRINIDTLTNQNCIWQIGSPSKTIFNSAYSFPRTIITDTINPYPVNDTSSFMITHIRQGNAGFNTYFLLDFFFKINTDSLSDFGIIEASIDNGLNWINLLTEDTTYGLYWINPKPALTGNTNGWAHFSEDLHNLTYSVGYSDTLLFRFTFISDSIQTNKEGWMIDDFMFNDVSENIQEIQNENLVSISPNPVSNELKIYRNKVIDNPRIQILNYTGQILLAQTNFTEETINTQSFNDGTYFLKFFNTKYFTIKKFIVIH